MNYKTILETIGKPPLVKLNKPSSNPDVQISAKYKFSNPSGSVKNRIVYHIIPEAEKSGRIDPGTTLVEATSATHGQY